jgi:hypothetical protein
VRFNVLNHSVLRINLIFLFSHPDKSSTFGQLLELRSTHISTGTSDTSQNIQHSGFNRPAIRNINRFTFAGTVLGKITASGKYVAYVNGALDGTGAAAGVVYFPIPDSAADQKAVIIARHAEVIESKLTGIDADGKTDLAALQIFCR